LVLTMLDYIEPRDLSRDAKFRIPALHNVNIFHSDFFDPDSAFSRNHAKTRFHWVVGNPPWKRLAARGPDEEDWHALRWVEEHEAEYPVGRRQAAEAFAWKVTNHLAPEGVVGLLLPAMS